MWVSPAACQDMIDRIAQVDFSEVVRLLTEIPGGFRYPILQVRDALCLYKRLLTVNGLHWGCRAVPSPSIDVIWHAHLQLTEKYDADCQHMFGAFLHHDPLFGTRDQPDREKYARAKEWTKAAMLHYFGLSGEDYTARLLFTPVDAMTALSRGRANA